MTEIVRVVFVIVVILAGFLLAPAAAVEQELHNHPEQGEESAQSVDEHGAVGGPGHGIHGAGAVRAAIGRNS